MKTSVLMNPPFSAKWEQKNDERFESFGLAPKSKADFAFILHGYHQLSADGKMAIVLPHGVLFRGASEGKIRKALLEIGAIEAIIGLPANIFYGTSIPTVMIVLGKNRDTKDVFFVDASNEFEKGKNQNFIHENHLDKIIESYENKAEVEKFSRLVTFDEVVENDFNLNIPRYIDTFEEEEPIDLGQTAVELMKINQEIHESEASLLEMINDLTGNEKTMMDLGLMKQLLSNP